MTSVPPPSQPPGSLHSHPEVPAGVVPTGPPPGALRDDGDAPPGSLSPVPFWAPLAAMIAAFVVATLAYVVIAAVVGGSATTTSPPPGVVISATLVQDAALVIAAVYFASLWANGLTPASFGLRRVQLGPAVGWTILAFIAFWILTAIYIKAVGQPDQQELTRDLRDEESLSALIGYAVLLAFVAPLAEELFFRGFVFGVLREKIGAVWAVLATGVVFGLVHVAGSPIETVGVLIILGSLLCVLYLQTGSLLPCIALHAINNAISFAATKSLPWYEGVAIVVACAAAAVGVAAAVTQRPALFSRA